MQFLPQQNRLLAVALGVSLAVHALALVVRFVDPEMLRRRSTDPALEIILVNARSEARPSRPEAYALANLDGGGANEAGRRSSPLPSLMQSRDGESLEKAQARVEPTKQLMPKLAVQDSGDLSVASQERPAFAQQPDSGAADRTLDVLSRLQAEIARNISDYQKTPRWGRRASSKTRPRRRCMPAPKSASICSASRRGSARKRRAYWAPNR